MLFAFIFAFNFHLSAQITDSFEVKLQWNEPEKFCFYDDTITRISFENAFYDDYKDIKYPLFKYELSVHTDALEPSFEVLVKEFEPVPESELLYLPSEIYSEPYSYHYIIASRDNVNLKFLLSPFFKNDDGMMRIVSCEVTYSLKEIKKEKRINRYAENSVLSTGTWYKMSLASTGIYRLTYSDLVSMGINVSSLNPKNIRLFHNGGGVLPVFNREFRNDDLVEIPIYVHGESDGAFDENDYVLFYGRGPWVWEYSSTYNVFEQLHNPYDDYSYVFMTIDNGEGKRIQKAEQVTGNADIVVDEFMDYKIINDDKVNLNNMGSTWYSDEFNAVTQRSYDFSFPNIIKERQSVIEVDVASRNFSTAAFSIRVNNNQIYNLNFDKINGQYKYAHQKSTGKVKFYPSQNDLKVDMQYIKSSSSSIGWLNYISINAWRELSFVGNMMSFRNPECNSTGLKYQYQIKNASSSVMVWDVTNPLEPKEIQLQYGSNSASFKTQGTACGEYIAFNGASYKTVGSKSAVANQNLHANYDFDYLIITHPDFYEHAKRLKDIHSRIDDLEIEIVTPQLIYNEFGCGAGDISAIRDYIKMLYDKSDHRLRYVLLFGDASYDYKNKSGKVCFVPTYESEASCDITYCKATDDFYVCLDDNEGDMDYVSAIDLSIGRMPVSNSTDATAMLDKIETYLSLNEDNAGPWRKVVTFIADDDATYYMDNCERLENIIKENGGDDIDFDKIYLDAYPQIATSSGQRAPECNAAITNRVERGSLVVNYVGHAGEVGWATERILTNDDIMSWRNINQLNLMVTASCEFSRYDDHTRTSAGEYVFLNHKGGAIVMMTTARVTYADANMALMRRLYEHMFDFEGGEYITMGDMYVYMKEPGDVNSKAFIYFGDPALRLIYPKNTIELTSINNHDVTIVDTLSALENVIIDGVVKDIFGNPMTDFNGVLHITMYDKENDYSTLGDEINIYNFKLRNSVIYNGKVNVVNGKFTAYFILPKDINYSYGEGLISMYAYSDDSDAHGKFSDFLIGGFNDNAELDDDGPELQLFINDDKFTDGSVTDENPLIIAYVRDENGINTSGAGIGHDITVTLTGATNKTYNLNQFYDAPLSGDEFGQVRYNLYGLNEGDHQMTMRVWDIYNNSSSATINFKVVKNNVIAVENVINYPNPMSNYTNFFFEHNQRNKDINIDIRIYDIMGQLVKTISEKSDGTSLRINPIKWDGTSDNGSDLPAGIYIYYVTVTNSKNETASGYSKLVID